MASLQNAVSTPATTITTTTETLASNVPVFPLVPPGASPQNVIVRGCVWVTTGTGVTALNVKLRVGQSNTTTNQVGSTITILCGASALYAVPFHFIDTVAADSGASGYSITVTQTGASGNGTVTAVTYETDISVP